MRKRGEEIVDAGAEALLDDDPGIVTSLARGLGVLRAFRRTDAGLGNQEIARRTGLPKATVSRLTYTLSRLGYLVYMPETANYRLGIGSLALGFAALGSIAVRDVARPMMQELADHTGGAVALGTRDGMAMVYVETCRGASAVQIALGTGSHLKLATSAIGKAYLAGLPEADYAHLAARLEAREGDAWPLMRKGLETARRDLSSRGFVLSAGDWKKEVHAVGVPLGAGTGELSYALNCGGPAYLFPLDRLVEDYGPRLVETARRIRDALGDGGMAAPR